MDRGKKLTNFSVVFAYTEVRIWDLLNTKQERCPLEFSS
jgi:hypothetical protein